MEPKENRTETTSDVDLHLLLQRGYRFAFSLTHDETAAEDLVQDAWLSILRAAGPWTVAYLLTAIRNRFIDQWRRDRLVGFEPLSDDQPRLVGGEPDLWSDGHEIGIRARALKRALDQLSPDERSALYLSAAEGYTAQEIANLFDKPRGTILSMVFRAKEKLRRQLRFNAGER
ncbi:MAG: RNA polymerase sigma factor [Candidatus Eisenbacteria sp.]|nr:RNA polymerase sigma factor [Candidatus Eisenbacteria bacterium]